MFCDKTEPKSPSENMIENKVGDKSSCNYLIDFDYQLCIINLHVIRNVGM